MSVYFYGCISMDGYLADKNHSLDWLNQTGTIEETDYDEFYQRMDITIMGRRTFREIEKAENPQAFYPATQNYVFTHSETFSEPGFIPVSGNVAEFVKELDKEKNIWIIGGNTILTPLLEADLVDELILQIAPVLLGEGIPLFPPKMSQGSCQNDQPGHCYLQKEMVKRFQLRDVKRYGPFAELVYGRE